MNSERAEQQAQAHEACALLRGCPAGTKFMLYVTQGVASPDGDRKRVSAYVRVSRDAACEYIVDALERSPGHTISVDVPSHKNSLCFIGSAP